MKILFVTLSNLGDVVLTLPVLQTLRKKYPSARIDVIVGASGKAVFENDTRLNRVHVYDKKTSWSQKLRDLGKIRMEHYDLIIDLRHSLIGLLGGARKRNSYLNGFSGRGHRTLKHLQALNDLDIAAEPAANAHESWLEGLLEQGEGKSPPLPAWELEGKHFVVAAIGSKSDLKKWPAENFAALLARIEHEQRGKIVLVGDAAEAADASKAVYAAAKLGARFSDWTGKTDFRGLVALIRRASLVVTNDSAPLHVADSLGIPALAVFGPSDPKKYGPRLAASRVVSKKLFCQPCEQAQCRFAHECMRELSVPTVYAQAARILEGKHLAEGSRILVMRLDRIGDLVLSLPAIEALRAHWPDATLSVMTRPETAALIEGHPAIDEVLVYDYGRKGKHVFGRGYFRFLEEVSKRRFDAAVILHPGIRSYLIPFLAGIPHRVSYKNKHAWLLTRAVKDERHLGSRHESEYALGVVSALTGVSAVSVKPPRLYPDPFALGPSNDRWIALHPGSSSPPKRWNVERFAELAGVLSREFPKYRVAVVGGLETQPDARRITAKLGARIVDFSGKLDLRQLTSFLSHCDLLISNDSGPVHVAAAVGTRVVSLFGRNTPGLGPQRWKPLGGGHELILKEGMDAITVEDVMRAVRKILNVSKKTAAGR